MHSYRSGGCFAQLEKQTVPGICMTNSHFGAAAQKIAEMQSSMSVCCRGHYVDCRAHAPVFLSIVMAQSCSTHRALMRSPTQMCCILSSCSVFCRPPARAQLPHVPLTFVAKFFHFASGESFLRGWLIFWAWNTQQSDVRSNLVCLSRPFAAQSCSCCANMLRKLQLAVETHAVCSGSSQLHCWHYWQGRKAWLAHRLL